MQIQEREDATVKDMKIYDNSYEPDEQTRKQRLQTGGITVEEAIGQGLKNKIMSLVNLDMKSVENASFEDMVKLVGIMEQTVREVKDKIDGPVIEQPDKSSSVKIGGLMNAPIIKQPPRNTFLSTKMKKIDDAAKARADNAYMANNQKENKK